MKTWLARLAAEVPCQSATVMRVDPARTRLDIVATHGSIHAPHLVLPMGVGIAGAVAQSGTPECLNDVQGDPRFLAAEFDIEKLLAVPIFGPGGQVDHVVNLSDPPDGASFTRGQVAQVEGYIAEHPLPEP